MLRRRAPLKRSGFKATHKLSFSHKQLVKAARGWLTKRAVVVVTELSMMETESADALGYVSGGQTILVECKTSRADFQADGQKIFRQWPEIGMGRLRYFLAPQGLLTEADLPQAWGLLEYNGQYVRETCRAIPFEERNHNAERAVLMSIILRFDISNIQGVAIRGYTFNHTKEDARQRASVGVLNENS